MMNKLGVGIYAAIGVRELVTRGGSVAMGWFLCCFFVALPTLGQESRLKGDADVSSGSARIERLIGLCHLWGHVKFFHPALAYRDIDWDQALISTIDLVEAAETSEEYRAALEHMLAFLEDPAIELVIDRPFSTRSEPRLPTLKKIRNVTVVEVTDYRAFAANQRIAGLFREAFKAATDGDGLILDLRRQDRPASGEAQAYLARALIADLPALFSREVVLPTPRRRVHSGYATRRHTHFYSGFMKLDHMVLSGTGRRDLPLAVIVGDGAEALWSILGGLQSSGVATIVQEGEPSPAYPPAGMVSLRLPDGIRVETRTEELIGFDGRVLFEADLHASRSETAAEDVAMILALESLGTPSEIGAERRGVPPRVLQSFEEPYSDLDLPPRSYRILALFRLWNVIKRFYPYKSLMTRPWADALPEFLPKFSSADSLRRYVLTIAELVTRIDDTHGSVGHDAFDEYIGTWQPPLLIDHVENRWVVTWVGESERDVGIRKGDVIHRIDGNSVGARIDEISPYMAASTPQALRDQLAFRLLGGSENSMATLVVSGENASIKTVESERSKQYWRLVRQEAESRGPVYRLLSSGFGYADLSRLEQGDVEAMFHQFREAPAIVFDLRGYPRGTAWAITPWLSDESEIAARFRRPVHLGGDPDSETAFHFVQRIPAGGAPWLYEGKIVVLIDERTASQGEHTVLFLQAAHNDVTTIGSPTNGANGDVTGLFLPGGVWVSFSGHEVRFANGDQLQRLGILPDLHMSPTLAGIRAGRDEVLEAAVDFLLSSSGRARREAPP